MCELISKIPFVGKLPIYRIPWKPCAVCSGLLVTLALFLLAASYTTLPGDRGALEGFQDNQSEWLDAVAQGVTRLGGWTVASIMMLVAVVYLTLRRQQIDAVVVVLSAVPIGLGFLLKEVVGRARPEYLLAGSEPSSLSFPSGHSLFAMIFGGLLILLIGELIGSIGIRRALQVIVGLLILAVGASRVYLGFHWPSDVLGGYLFGGMALLGLVWVRTWLINRQSTPSRVVA